MKGFKKSAKSCGSARKSYANGGMIRGPGTGTSDDIKKTVPEGSYIMPADSTQAIGPENLDGMGAPVPVNVSNGEYQMPPEQVHAVGVQALEQMKSQTHAPVGPKGFKPGQKPGGDELFFNNGGPVRDKEKERERMRAALQRGPFSAPAGVPGATGDTNPYVGAAASEPIVSAVSAGVRSAQDIGNRLSQPVRAVHSAAQDAAASVGQANRGYLNRMRTNKGLPSLESVERDKALDGAMVSARDRQPPQQTVGGMQPSAGPAPTDGMVGKMASDMNQQYGVNILGERGPAVTPPLRAQGGGTTPVDMRIENEAMAGVNAIRQKTIDAQPRGFRKVIGDSATEERNARLGDELKYRDAIRKGDTRLAAELSGQASRAGIEGKGNAAALERMKLQERGTNRREGLRAAMDSRRLDGEEQTRGFTTRAQQRLESLHDEYQKAGPGEREAIAEQIRVLSGGDDSDKYTVVPGGQQQVPDGLGGFTTITNPSFAINNRTSGVVQPGAQAQSQQPPSEPKTRAEYDSLPPGTQYIKDGKLLIKK